MHSPSISLLFSKRPLIIIAAVVAVAVLWTIGPSHRAVARIKQAADDVRRPTYDCQAAPGADKVVLVIKTGSSEIYKRLPHHFDTLLGCIKDSIVFSDVAQTFGRHQIYDALEDYSYETRQRNNEFRAYERLNYNQHLQQDNSKSTDGAWDLDKWKFIPMTVKTSARYPDHDWYIFIDADTSLSWSNALLYLGKLNASEPLYVGNVASLDIGFAHGGSGYAISKAAMKLFVKGYAEHGSRWEDYTRDTCCGDHALAKAFMDLNIHVTHAAPPFEGCPLRLADFYWARWCSPSITFHHLSSSDIDVFWHFNQRWVAEHGWSVPYLARDIFEALVEPSLAPLRSDWNNESRDRRYGDAEWEKNYEDPAEQTDATRTAPTSLEACVEACQQNQECLQYKYKPGKCFINMSVLLGQLEDGTRHEFDDEDFMEGPRWRSGWMMERIAGWKTGERMQCHEPDWGFAGDPVYNHDVERRTLGAVPRVAAT